MFLSKPQNIGLYYQDVISDIMNTNFDIALGLVEDNLGTIRERVPYRDFDPTKPAEVEVNKFYFEGNTVDRIMVVLRSNGCNHYNSKKGCSMCGHYDGTCEKPITAEQYFEQWKNVVSGSCIENQESSFDINKYPVLCLYNLGSFLNPEEMPPEAVEKVFSSISEFPGIKKVIIESRAEHVESDILEKISRVYSGIIEVGVGLESVNYEVRELCHHKSMPDLSVFEESISTLRDNGFKSLVYVNQKPPFLTERESIDDAVMTTIYAFERGADAVSIEPTSIQPHTLTEHLHKTNMYRVPWLWSVIETVERVVRHFDDKKMDLRIGGYFGEKVLSGSQGVGPGAERNEIFPLMTSGNCQDCSDRVIDAIKAFNETYDVELLKNQEPCGNCYDSWKDALKEEDHRSIPERIICALGV